MIKQPSMSCRAISPLVVIAATLLAPLSAQSKPWHSDTPGNEAIPPLRWTNSEDHQRNPASRGLRWEAMDRQPSADDEVPPPQTVLWKDTPPGEVITADDIPPQEKTQDEPLVVIEPSGTTFANDKAIWRDEQWHPQISSLVPVGFGPKGLMLSAGIYGWDCIPAAYGACKVPKDFESYVDELERRGEAEWEGSIGFGNAEKLVGLTITGMFEETNLPIGERNTYQGENPRGLLDNYYVGMHISRNIGPDTSARIGIKNWIDVRDEQQGESMRGKSAYGVLSQRIRLKDNQQDWFSNLYLTAGIGNGEFRSVAQKFQSSVAKQREAGCPTYGYNDAPGCTGQKRSRAGARAVSYGEFAPIGAIALEAYPGFNLISEWSEGNLKAGFSVRPFSDLGLVFTSMWGSLLQNCDWGCKVPIRGVPGGVQLEDDLTTERIKWSAHLYLNLKF